MRGHDEEEISAASALLGVLRGKSGAFVKLETRAVAGFLKRPDPKVRAVLLYGPDAGLVKERAEGLARTVVDDLGDPFRVADLSGQTVHDDPARLADEAAAIAMTGGRRVVRVRDADDTAEAFTSFFERPLGDSLIVAEAGELDGRSALRRLFEKSELAACIACYRDEGGGLEAVIRDTLKKADVRVEDDAAAWLADRLGGDRLVTRGEAEKLALYVGAGNTATLADAQALIGDSADIDLDDLTDAVAGGDVAALERSRGKLDGEGVSAVAQLRAVQRHFARLHLCAGLIAAGQNEKAAMAAVRVFWKQEPAFRAQLKRWTSGKLSAALGRIVDAEIACKSGSAIAELIAAQCLMGLAELARAPAPANTRR